LASLSASDTCREKKLVTVQKEFAAFLLAGVVIIVAGKYLPDANVIRYSVRIDLQRLRKARGNQL
jgi:hypothetical protein